MTRCFLLDDRKAVRVSLLSQAPNSNDGSCVYEHLTIEHKKVKNIRTGE